MHLGSGPKFVRKAENEKKDDALFEEKTKESFEAHSDADAERQGLNGSGVVVSVRT